MKNIARGALLGAISLSFAACDVDQTKEAKLPEVEVDAKSGQMPEFNVEGPEVQVGSEKKTIEVPTVDVDVPDDKKE